MALLLKDEELAIDVRKDLELYMEQMDKKFDLNKIKWQEKYSQLMKEKAGINKKIYLL